MARFYFLAYLVLNFCFVGGESPQYVLKGTSNHFKPNIRGRPTSILWKHNGNKAVEFNGREQHEFEPYEGRVTLDWHSAELEIKGLRFEDSGDYDLEVEINRDLHTSRHKLEVIEKVVKPTISCKKIEGSSLDGSRSTATLLCSAEPRQPESLTKFEWKSKGMFHSGQKLEITLGDEHDEIQYSCSVSNPLSNETTSFTAKECYNDGGSSAGMIAGLSILFVLLLLLLILGIVGYIYCKRKQKACFAKRKQDDPEKQAQTEGTGSEKTEQEEKRRLLERNETLPSQQRLVQSNDPPDVSQTENNLVKDSAAEEDQMPQKGIVGKRKDYYENINCDNRNPSKKGKGFKGSEEDNREKFYDAPEEHRGDIGEANDQERASTRKDSSEESFSSATEVPNDPDPADVSGQSSKDEQFGLKAAPEQTGLEITPVCSEDNKEEQKDPGSTPVSPRSDSPFQQAPGNDSDIYTSDADQDQVKEAAEKEDPLSEFSDTKEANNQDTVITPRESTEEDPQPDRLVTAGQKEPDTADVSNHLTEDEQSGQKPKPGLEIKTGEPKERSIPSSSEPPPSQEGDGAEINEDDPGVDEPKQAAEKEPSQTNSSDLKKAQNPPDPAVLGSDEETAQEGGNNCPLGGASMPPSDGDETVRHNESDLEKNRDSQEDKTKIQNTPPSPSPPGAESPPQTNPNPGNEDCGSPADHTEIPSSDQTDSKPDPADDSQRDHNASPIQRGYVRKEAHRIDEEYVRAGQTQLKGGRESRRNKCKPPQSTLPPAAESSVQENLNPDTTNGDPDLDQSKVSAAEDTPSDQNNSGEGNESDPADGGTAPKPQGDTEEANNQERASTPKDSSEDSYDSATEDPNDPDPADVSGQSPKDENFSVNATPEQIEEGLNVSQDQSTEESQSDLFSEDGLEKTVQGSGSSGVQQGKEEPSTEESPNISVQKDPDMNSDNRDAPLQHVATSTLEKNNQQESGKFEQPSTPASTNVDDSKSKNESMKNEGERSEEDVEKTSKSPTENQMPTDTLTPEAGQVQGGN